MKKATQRRLEDMFGVEIFNVQVFKGMSYKATFDVQYVNDLGRRLTEYFVIGKNESYKSEIRDFLDRKGINYPEKYHAFSLKD